MDVFDLIARPASTATTPSVILVTERAQPHCRQRVWTWRRHRGVDPIALDLIGFGTDHHA